MKAITIRFVLIRVFSILRSVTPKALTALSTQMVLALWAISLFHSLPSKAALTDIFFNEGSQGRGYQKPILEAINGEQIGEIRNRTILSLYSNALRMGAVGSGNLTANFFSDSHKMALLRKLSKKMLIGAQMNPEQKRAAEEKLFQSLSEKASRNGDFLKALTDLGSGKNLDSAQVQLISTTLKDTQGLIASENLNAETLSTTLSELAKESRHTSSNSIILDESNEDPELYAANTAMPREDRPVDEILSSDITAVANNTVAESYADAPQDQFEGAQVNFSSSSASSSEDAKINPEENFGHDKPLLIAKGEGTYLPPTVNSPQNVRGLQHGISQNNLTANTPAPQSSNLRAPASTNSKLETHSSSEKSSPSPSKNNSTQLGCEYYGTCPKESSDILDSLGEADSEEPLFRNSQDGNTQENNNGALGPQKFEIPQEISTLSQNTFHRFPEQKLRAGAGGIETSPPNTSSPSSQNSTSPKEAGTQTTKDNKSCYEKVTTVFDPDEARVQALDVIGSKIQAKIQENKDFVKYLDTVQREGMKSVADSQKWTVERQWDSVKVAAFLSHVVHAKDPACAVVDPKYSIARDKKPGCFEFSSQTPESNAVVRRVFNSIFLNQSTTISNILREPAEVRKHIHRNDLSDAYQVANVLLVGWSYPVESLWAQSKGKTSTIQESSWLIKQFSDCIGDKHLGANIRKLEESLREAAKACGSPEAMALSKPENFEAFISQKSHLKEKTLEKMLVKESISTKTPAVIDPQELKRRLLEKSKQVCDANLCMIKPDNWHRQSLMDLFPTDKSRKPASMDQFCNDVKGKYTFALALLARQKTQAELQEQSNAFDRKKRSQKRLEASENKESHDTP